MKTYLAKIIRFIEIDLQYFSTNLPLYIKLNNIIATDFAVIKNAVLRSNNYSVIMGDKKIFYDTKFATKTFLSAVYDFYLETVSLEIFKDSKNPVIVDVGANIGQFLFAVKSFFPYSIIFSFEPDKEIIKILNKNASQYIDSHIENVALFNRKGNGAFYRNKQFSEWSSLIKFPKNLLERTIVPLDRGDNYIQFAKLKRIDLVKIDVEGVELEVIQGMKKTLKKTRYLLVEASLSRDKRRERVNKLFEQLILDNFVLCNVGRIFFEGKGKRQGAVDLLFKNSKIQK